MLFLFDVDGTLLVSGGAGARALDRAFRDCYGLDGAMDGILAGGKTDPALVDEVCRRRLGRPAAAGEVTRVLAIYLGYLEEEVARAPRYRLMPAVVETLDALQARGHVLGLATGNVERGARIKLGRGGISARFGFGGFGCDSPLRADLVARAYQRGQAYAGRGFAPGETYVVGDTPLDVAAAKAVGLRSLAVATGSYSEAELAAAEADVVVPDLGQLASALNLD